MDKRKKYTTCFAYYFNFELTLTSDKYKLSPENGLGSMSPENRNGLESMIPKSRNGLGSMSPEARNGLESMIPKSRNGLGSMSPENRSGLESMIPKSRNGLGSMSPENSWSGLESMIPKSRNGLGSMSPENRNGLESMPSFNSFLSRTIKEGMTLSEWDNTFSSVSAKQDPGFIAAVQKVIAAKGDVLVTLGAESTFQATTCNTFACGKSFQATQGV